jgi:uncharacterized membrane protein
MVVMFLAFGAALVAWAVVLGVIGIRMGRYFIALEHAPNPGLPEK